jgi:hypothetical protein
MPLFTPEEKKIFDQEVESVKQGMLDNKRALVSKYGKDAEKIIQGRAVKQALEKIENLRQNQEMENNKLKEAVKAALMNPKKADLNKDGKLSSYEKTRGAAIEKAMQKEDLDLGHEDDEPHMLKADLYRIGKYAMELYQMVDQFEGKGEVDFPHWWQSKIIKSKEMMSSAKHYLDFELKEPKIDAVIGVEDMMNEEINQSNLQGELIQAFAQLNPKVSVYGNNGEVKFEIRNDANESIFNSVINYLEGNNFVVDREQSKPYYDREDDRESFPRIRFTIKGPNTGNSLPYLDEKTLTKPELKKREEIVKAMKKDFKGPKGVMYAIATEKAKKVAETIAKELKEERFEKGTDIGKKGAGFAKIAKTASKEYGSEEAGKRVAGAILKKVLKNK